MLGLLMLGNQCRADVVASYGAKVKFKKGAVMKFADFDLRYVGQRKVATPTFSRGMVFEDFQASKGSEKVMVSWSAGTGDIGPVGFEVGGGRFQLELRLADRIGRLKENELVVRRR